jgi:serine/threonine protein kinase
VKAIPKASLDTLQEVQNVLREARVLFRLEHDNIVKCFGLTHTRNFLLIGMEPAGSCNLHRYMCKKGGRLSMLQARFLVSQVTQALIHCHKQGVAHADLKPENVVVSEDGMQVKLVDFGMAVEANQFRTDLRGTMPFMAPEIFLQAPYMPAPVDIWALGVLLLEMLCGAGKLNRMMGWPQNVPPSPRLRAELTHVFESQPKSRALCISLGADGVRPSCSLMSAMHGALDVEPARRLTAAQLAHSEWLSDGGMLPLLGPGLDRSQGNSGPGPSCR